MDLIKTKTFKEFKIIEYEIGHGTTGRVLLGQWLVEPKQYVAVKEINIKLIENDEMKMKQIANEINSLRSVESPYIVKLYGSVQTDNNLYMFLEYCEDGDLKAYISKRQGPLTEPEAVLMVLTQLAFFRHIVEGFKELQKNNIIHRDIKPANILLKQNTAKISDFGFSRVLANADQSAIMTLLGTPLYTAPEILNGTTVVTQDRSLMRNAMSGHWVLCCTKCSTERLLGREPSWKISERIYKSPNFYLAYRSVVNPSKIF
jgi:serine/threonine protein kinase